MTRKAARDDGETLLDGDAPVHSRMNGAGVRVRPRGRRHDGGLAACRKIGDRSDRRVGEGHVVCKAVLIGPRNSRALRYENRCRLELLAAHGDGRRRSRRIARCIARHRIGAAARSGSDA